MDTSTEFGRREFAIQAGRRIGEFPDSEAEVAVDNVVYYSLERKTTEVRLKIALRIADTLNRQSDGTFVVEVTLVEANQGSIGQQQEQSGGLGYSIRAEDEASSSVPNGDYR